MPRLFACYFEPDGDAGPFARMARVLRWSALEQLPAWEVTVEQIGRPKYQGLPQHTTNSAKLDRWVEVACGAPDGAELLLIDADTFIARPLDDVWAQPFDIAFTVRRGFMFPFNLGVMFFRVSPAVRAFFELWRETNLALLGNREKPWRQTFGGINQAAFGRMQELGLLAGLRLLELECREWNCEESAWASYDPAVTRVVHLKSALRRSLFYLQAAPPTLHPLIGRWRALERSDRAARLVGAR
jgi:hypothetical protein